MAIGAKTYSFAIDQIYATGFDSHLDILVEDP